ncbi:2-(3-amino-3-carboxypropyl)histidine synthase subunit 2 [Pleurostoma richardsiae]|uniref:2-(3-amino-3-carboxypropyl)histidine synthase subunit 2 n=1 Tax=Pleurostoma richardsiae TaxID=41990 RepID=A0AA38RXI2_9PEZI|nr:2-(3-amino-3-carboxypropyl)histidine synthase subunit 2 [Pleurostoma richardsiae]
MAAELTTAPVLSTPAEFILDHDTPAPLPADARPKSDDELREFYEVCRTAQEIRAGRRRRIALQFPDAMLCDAPRLVGLLSDELARLRAAAAAEEQRENEAGQDAAAGVEGAEKIYILADTSYSACCVDEIAAEHADADVVVHYGRSCLSPTSRLPVIYVFTKHKLDLDEVAAAFEKEIPDKGAQVVLMADVTYQDHVPEVARLLREERGYSTLLATEIFRDPLGRIPNRKIMNAEGMEVKADESGGLDLKEYSIFHISSPPTSLLLALSSRVDSFHIFPTPDTASSSPSPTSFQTARILGRRYARVLTLSTAGVIGVLVNTLSVANYLSSVDAIRRRIAAAGKKSYTVVVGKLNPAKLANFAEVDGWVVVGCWESSLVEDDAGFYRPVITPFELEVALTSDEERVWGDKWWGGIEAVEKEEVSREMMAGDVPRDEKEEENLPRDHFVADDDESGIDDEESEPPQFDLRTGRLVSHSRPMRMVSGNRQPGQAPNQQEAGSAALTLRPKSEVATVNGVISPGAEFLRSQRTWQGLGTDFDAEERSTTIEEGRSGIARGYTVGEVGANRR